MKISTLKKAALAICCIGLMSSSANATVFTAVASGNFSSSATWVGGVAPGNILIGDQVTIPSGLTVMLDEDETINGTLAALTINGTLTATTGSSLVLATGPLNGSGTLNADSLALGLVTGFGFTGTINAQHLTSTGATIATNATITVASMLELTGSALNLNNGNLTLNNGTTVVVSGGTLAASGGTYNLVNAYNVRYVNSSANTGLEISGAGLTDVEVNVPSSSSVTMSSNLSIKGTLMLTSGNLSTNNHNLLFTGNSNFASSGSGMIVASSGTDVIVTSTGNFSGGLRFSSTGNTINNLTINMGNGSNHVILGSNLTVNGTLNLQSGSIYIASNKLMVGSSGTIMGGSSTSYVMTTSGGSLMASLGAGTTATYHVGTENHYAPVIITGNTGSASGMVGVGVSDSVNSEGNSGVYLGNYQPLVNATWYITHTATANIDLKLQAMWSSNMEVNGFDRTKLYLSHYMNGDWDVNATATATTATNGMFTTSRDHITSLSPFAVMGENANTTNVKTIAAIDRVTVYPNPATGTMSFVGSYSHARIYNLIGNLVQSEDLSSNTISVADLPNGNYTLVLNSNTTGAIAHFIKQ